jgi:hypothetical protein
MEKVVKQFHNFREGHKADWRYYLSLTPAKRLEILLDLVSRQQDAQDEDPKGPEFIELLNSAGVKYVIIGGYAVAYHGHPPYTGDIDIFIDLSEANAERMEQVIRRFGFQETGLSAKDFTTPDSIVQLGRPPNRIDVVTSVDAVDFREAWESRIEATLDGTPVHFISKGLLLRNKKTTGRARDLADIEEISDDDR